MNKVSLHRHPPQMPRALGPSGSARRALQGDEPLFDWERLVPLLIHPVKVSIIEALLWMGKPLSASQLVLLFDSERDCYLSLVSYHMKELAKAGAIERVRSRPVRGAREHFYFFPKP